MDDCTEAAQNCLEHTLRRCDRIDDNANILLGQMRPCDLGQVSSSITPSSFSSRASDAPAPDELHYLTEELCTDVDA
jgi:hypothetical protein